MRPRDKRPALASWQEYQERRATEDEIREWWNRWPQANVGVVTGAISGLVVLDLDGSAAVAFAKGRGVPETPVAATGKGFHVYFAHPGRPVPNAAALGGVKGIDVRGDGGYVVAPPSVHPSGRRYTWTKNRPFGLPLAPVPEWLLELLVARNQVVAAGEPGGREPGWVEQLLAGVPEGQRDDACTRLAGHFLAKGLPEGEVLALLLAWNQKNQPPLPERDVEKCVRSVARREARKPPRPVPANFWLGGPVYAPEGWKSLVICRDWREARRLAAQGNAVVVARKDGSLPPGAAKLVAEAGEVKTAGFTQEEVRKLAWALYPLRVMRQAVAATDGTAALDSAPAPEPVTEASASGLVQEMPGGTRVPPVIPEPAPEQDDTSPFGFSLADLPQVVDAGPGTRSDPPAQVGDAAQETAENAAQVGRYPFDPATETYLAAMRERCVRLGQDGLGPGSCWRCDLYPWEGGCGPRIKSGLTEKRYARAR